MPFLLTFIGLLMIVTGARNTHVAFARQVQGDFTGQGNFITWVVAIGAVGSLGYVSELRTFSRYFMALILLGLVLSNRGLFAQFSAALASGPVAPVALSDNTPAIQSAVTSASAANMTPAQIDAKISSNQQGAFGQPADSGHEKFNGWMNYIFGLKWLS